MRYLSLLIVFLLFSACAEEDPPSIPSFPSQPQDTEETETDTSAEADVATPLDVGDAPSLPDTTAGDTDVAIPVDSEESDAGTPLLDISQDTSEIPDSADTADPVDTVSTEPDATIVPESDTEEDVTTAEDTAVSDTEDAEEPGECVTDNDCQFLTKKECCPFFTPCAEPGEVGTLEDEVEHLAWLQAECPQVESCPDVAAPECNSCHNIYIYSPVCDKEVGECIVDSEVDCTAVCEAAASTETCPSISHPEALTEALLIECGCL